MGPGLWEVSRPTGENLKRPTVLKETGRRSVRGGVPTLERGNDQKKNNRGHGPLLVRLRGAESEGCKSPPGRRLLPET